MILRIFYAILFLNLTLLVYGASAKGKKSAHGKKHHSGTTKTKARSERKNKQSVSAREGDKAAETKKAAVARTLKEKNFHLPDSAKKKKQ